ncbi:restriction endonuclease [Oerskovia sp. Root22]|uniref:restriction endonuclease n=1 Tax=Oerskovia sp. Root22 TaxID=1736494 RepID=UPI0006FFA13F|nr:restriction endonuclease [Oerskovia sp. Root22]KRC42720.1 hypothetical protein ASE15_01450 [Oerskovia sp. Root22]
MSESDWRPGEHIQSDYAAERMAAHAMRGMGYPDAQETPVGPDGGVDVRASHAIAQVKWRAAQTGRQEIQALVGARGRNHYLHLLFFSASGFSQQAVEYGEMMEVALFTFNVVGGLTPITSKATEALRRPVNPQGVAQSSVSSQASRISPSTKAWWKRHWIHVLTIFGCVGAVVSTIGVFADPEITWGQVIFYWTVAVVGTALWRRQLRATLTRPPTEGTLRG